MMRASHTCVRCGEFERNRCRRPRSGLCLRCAAEHLREGAYAIGVVKRAVDKGDIPKPTTLLCTDCRKPAREYDHRDYLQPLKVDPVCRSCNQKRGVAFDSVLRPQYPAPIAVNTGEVSSLLLQGAASGGLP